ncbi:leucine-rich repeat domain-containing protein [Ruminococcus sp.]|uniref:leucine-rich repeat domain-containing protein n=1 Tax=Ruminococcus sp. TaxID=41978 RepID=UPI00388D5840
MSIASEITRINTNIAAAYSAASDKGAAMPQAQNSANLAATINSISGGSSTAAGKDINLYDYNGTLLHSYTFAEAAALKVLPPQPIHSGLTAQGWNCPLNQIKSYAHNGRPLNVGSVYTTTDGSTRLYLFVAKGTRIPSLQIHMTLGANQTVTVDWGDGSTGTVSNPGSVAAEVYAEKTNYTEAAADTILCVRLIGGSFILGYNGTASLFGAGYEPGLIKAELGSNCTGLLPYAFYGSTLNEVVISPGITSLPDHAFFMCYDLKAVILPKSVSEIGAYALGSCYHLALISFSAYITDIATYALNGCNSLMTVVLPEGLMTAITNNTFRGCKNLQSIRIPYQIAGIYAGAFMNCTKLYEVDLTEFDDPSSLPGLANTNAFSGTLTTLRFKVANQEMQAAFAAATNWSAYAGQFTTG